MLPLLDHEIGLAHCGGVDDLQLQVLGPGLLVDYQLGTAAVVAPLGPKPGEHGDDFVLTGFHVAEEQPVHTAAAQGTELAIGVEVVGDDLAVDGQLDGVQLEELADVQRQEDRQLGVTGIQQLFLEDEQVAVQLEVSVA